MRSKLIVYVPDYFKARIKEYNKRNPNNVIDISETLQNALNETLQEIESDYKYCCLCRTVKPKDCFNLTSKNDDNPRGYCIKCSEARKEKMYRYSMNGNRCKALEMTNGKCLICGSEASDVHHIIPLSDGGNHDLNNLVPLCRGCHLKAHNGAYSNIKGVNKDLLQKFLSNNTN